MKDYHALWERWSAFLNEDLKFRKEILDAFHIEIKKGFDVVVKIAIEELESTLSDKAILSKTKESVETALAMCVLAGYTLFLIDHEIDPIEKNLLARTSTNALGNRWIAGLEKDRHESYLLHIDSIYSLFLETRQQNEMNVLLLEHGFLKDIFFKDATYLITFLNWSGHQGFILGMIEQELFQK